MSRLAKKPVILPSGVNVAVEADKFIVEGPKGKLEQDYLSTYVEIKVDADGVMVNRKGNTNSFKAYQGLYWSLLQNNVKGVSEGFMKELLIKGTGYKWEIKGKFLECHVGLSHKVDFPIPEGITIIMENPTTVSINGIDKHLVGQTAANIRYIRPPEVYKGKGIRYINEVVKLKAGKATA